MRAENSSCALGVFCHPLFGQSTNLGVTCSFSLLAWDLHAHRCIPPCRLFSEAPKLVWDPKRSPYLMRDTWSLVLFCSITLQLAAELVWSGMLVSPTRGTHEAMACTASSVLLAGVLGLVDHSINNGSSATYICFKHLQDCGD